ncbi:hypothetical protein [Georgenia sp. Z1491]|uniref:hypothetical protein n=1 Tax=Georgenia sp. Z1491 TaxID=3416707 RepID=UPI003CED90C7
MTAVPDLLDTLLRGTRAEIEAAGTAVAATLGRGDADVVGRADRALRDGSASLRRTPDGGYDLVVGPRTWRAGRFTTPTLAELRAAAAAAPTDDPGDAPAGATLSVLVGAHPLTDIGALQAFAARDTLFQVASQLNCLEAPSPRLVPVPEYLSDPTQGPRAAIGAFPGALLRHHAAPDGAGGTFVQTDDRQVELLADALPARIGRAVGGYLRPGDLADVDAVVRALAERREDIRVGVHDDVEVALGASWRGSVPPGTRIAQVCTSTLASGLYGDGRPPTGALLDVARTLLRAAYLGTLLAAAATGRRRVVLTLIGGGVFGNPHSTILGAIDWALTEYAGASAGPLDVVLNARELDPGVDLDQLRDRCERRGGKLRRAA